MADVNWDDPCAAAKAMRDAYYAIITGTQESEVTYMVNGGQRTVRYAQANLTALISELRLAEQDCAAQQGTAPRRRRYAIQAGASMYPRRSL